MNVKEQPLSLFFLNDSTWAGWSPIAESWSTARAGAAWKKLEGLKGIVQAVFPGSVARLRDRISPRPLYETTDGGKKWTKLPAGERRSSRRCPVTHTARLRLHRFQDSTASSIGESDTAVKACQSVSESA